MSEIRCQETKDSLIIFAKIVPGSSKTCIAGLLDGMLKVKIAAPPEKGKANKELTSFLAKKLGVKKRDVSVISGHTNPLKQVEIKDANKTILENLNI